MKKVFVALAFGLAVIFAPVLCAPPQEAQSTPASVYAETKAAPAFTVRVEGSGPPVLLIPGMSCDGSVWDATVDHLKGRYQCHVLSLAGFAGAAPIGGPFLPQVHDQIVAYVHENALRRPAIIGHSLGGAMAFWLASSDPELFGPIIAVDGVPFLPALMNPAATAEESAAMGAQIKVMMEQGGRAAFEAQTRASMASMITDPDTADRMAGLSIKSDPSTVGRALHELMGMDLRPRIAAIKTPVLLMAPVGSATDQAARQRTATAYQAQIANLPGARVMLVPGCRHFIMLDNPAWFHASVDQFLQEHQK